jgi:uncharacterized protein (DUF779 family)
MESKDLLSSLYVFFQRWDGLIIPPFRPSPMLRLPDQVIATDAAIDLIATLHGKHGDLMFHQSGGCCDGSSPMCYPRGEFLIGDQDVLIGTLGDTPFYMSRSQFEYWKHTQLILDVVPGRGGMFSLEGPEGVRFLIRSRVFTNEEIAQLRAAARI